MSVLNSSFNFRFKNKTLTMLSFSVCMGLGTAGAFAHNLTIASSAMPTTLDPVSENKIYQQRIVPSIYDTLIKFDYRDGGKLVPDLAVSWSVIDAKTVEFKLRPGVVFHNGDTFDANDVVATFEPTRIGQVKGVPVISKPFLGGIDHVEVIDPMTVRIHMKRNDAIALMRFASYPAQIISQTALKNAASYDDFTKVDAGSGPYKLASLEYGRQIVLKKFDKYWGSAKAAADKVTFVKVPEQATEIAGLFSGQFDIVTDLASDSFAQVEANPDTAIVGGPVNNIRGLFYDSVDSPIADARIRRAMNFAINRQQLVDTLFSGRTKVPHGWQMSTFGAMYLKDRPIPEYNPNKAKKLLKEAGYKGQEIIFRTQRNYYSKQGETALILQSMWKKVGLNVKVEFKENWSQVNKDLPDRAITDSSNSAFYPDPLGQWWRRFGPKSARVRNDYYAIDPEMLRLGNELETTIDQKERRQVFSKMLDHFDQNPHGAVLFQMPVFMGVRSDRLQIKTLPTGILDLTTTGVSFK